MDEKKDEPKNANAAIDFTILPSGKVKVMVVSRGGFPGLKNTSREVPAEAVRAAEQLAGRDVFAIPGN